MIIAADMIGNSKWKEVLVVIKNGLSLDELEMVQKLRACEEPGVLLANLMSEAHFWKRNFSYTGTDYVEQYLNTIEDSFVLFCNEFEFDMRGSISLAKPCATITVGEIMSSPPSSELQGAKCQLTLRGRLLLWAVMTMYPGEFQTDSIVLIGRIFVPRRNDEKHRPQQIAETGISFHIHRV